MPTHISTRPRQRSGAPSYLSVEGRITIFTIFTCVGCLGWTSCEKRFRLSVNKHYVTRILLWVWFVAVKKGCKGWIICHIRSRGRGAGVLGDCSAVSGG